MVLATMRFSDLEWKYNPLTLKITHELSHSKRFLPDLTEVVEDPRVRVNVITGKGELFGEDCLEQYKEIERVFRSGKKGVLTLPNRAPVYAFFTKLYAEATDAPDLVVYGFEFVEAYTQDRADDLEYHIGNGWDSLYSIAYEYNVAVEKLVELNPWIKRPDEQLAGKKVRLC